MKSLRLSLFATVLFAGVASVALSAPNDDVYWAQWRGPLCTGAAPKGNPPATWSETENIRWKTKIPGKGHAAPIIWGNRVFVQTAVEIDEAQQKPAADGSSVMEAQPQGGERRGERRGNRRGGGGFGRAPKPAKLTKFQVLALDRKSGKILWTTTVCEEVPKEVGHADASLASNSPATDGKYVYAYFGSRGLYCLDMKGKIKWSKDFGDMQTRNEFGEGSSPALFGDTIVINWDHEGQDFVTALDKKTGKELWKVERDEPTSWSTPVVLESGGKAQVVVNASNQICSYDLKSGKEIWRCKGMTANTVPSPVADEAMVYCLSGFRGAALLAIKYGSAKGDISDSPTIAWSHDKNTPYVPSPLLYKNVLYFLENNRPILSAFNAKTGEALFEQKRLDGLDMIYASIVGGGGRVYVVGRNGKTVVLRAGAEGEVLGTPSLNEGFDASPAIAGNELYLRGKDHLYCIAEG